MNKGQEHLLPFWTIFALVQLVLQLMLDKHKITVNSCLDSRAAGWAADYKAQ